MVRSSYNEVRCTFAVRILLDKSGIGQ